MNRMYPYMNATRMKHTTNKIDQNPLTALAINEDPITKRQQPQNGCDSGP